MCCDSEIQCSRGPGQGRDENVCTAATAVADVIATLGSRRWQLPFRRRPACKAHCDLAKAIKALDGKKPMNLIILIFHLKQCGLKPQQYRLKAPDRGQHDVAACVHHRHAGGSLIAVPCHRGEDTRRLHQRQTPTPPHKKQVPHDRRRGELLQARPPTEASE